MDFEVTYSHYAEFQDRMEQYWCLRWLVQENVTETTALVIRDNLVRFDRLPWIQRLADLPAQKPDTAVRVAIADVHGRVLAHPENQLLSPRPRHQRDREGERVGTEDADAVDRPEHLPERPQGADHPR